MHYISKNNQAVCPVHDLLLGSEYVSGRTITTAQFSCNEMGLLKDTEIVLVTMTGSLLFVLIRNATFSNGRISFEGVVTEQAQGDPEIALAAVKRFQSHES
jgi:hypothetical protein